MVASPRSCDVGIMLLFFQETLALPQMLVVGDVQEVFVPLSQGLLVEPGKAAHLLDALAQEIPTMFRDTKDTETILLPAVQVSTGTVDAPGLSICLSRNESFSNRYVTLVPISLLLIPRQSALMS